jgi:hypothetical protein
VRRVSPFRAWVTLALGGLHLLIAGLAGCARGEGPTGGRAAATGVESGRQSLRDTAAPAGGYVLFSPLLSTTTYLIDRRGRVVHRWDSDRPPGASVYLLENGHLLRCERFSDTPMFQAGGEGGRLREYTWDGELVWDYVLATPRRVQHHDIEPLPNGHVLAVVWEHKSRAEALAAGRRRELVPGSGMMVDCILEVQPLLPDGGRIVWEWHAWDHLIQDVDPAAGHYGDLAAHPELVDVNGDHRPRFTDQVLQRLKTLGYIAGGSRTGDADADFLHVNAVAYNPSLDQIALTVHTFGEIWIIDHGTTTVQAAGHVGGRTGRGGDLLYRWGNPAAYGRAPAAERRLYGPHDARWIPPGLPGAGNMLVFNNGLGRPGTDFASVIEIAPPLRRDGTYAIKAGAPFGPHEPVWIYPGPGQERLFADFISGAERMPNGNALVCEGPTGRFFEVTREGRIVWEYRNRFMGSAPNPAGDPRLAVFRVTYVPADHPALIGRTLTALPD